MIHLWWVTWIFPLGVIFGMILQSRLKLGIERRLGERLSSRKSDLAELMELTARKREHDGFTPTPITHAGPPMRIHKGRRKNGKRPKSVSGENLWTNPAN